MKRISLMASLVSVVLAATPLAAQPIVVKEEKAGMLKLAKVAPEVAMATALTKVPNGRVQAAEIENEDGKLIYTFAISVAGKSGVEEVNVNAKTGAIISAVHESPEDEAKEAKDDKAKADKLKAPKAKAGPPKVVKPPRL